MFTRTRTNSSRGALHLVQNAAPARQQQPAGLDCLRCTID